MRVKGRENATSRHAKIASFVGLNGYTRFSELAHLAGVSELTIRRDLRRLQERRLLKLVPGGATADMVGASMVHFKQEVARRVHEKNSVGTETAKLIADGETVLIDGGTTTWYVAKALRGRRLQVVTNSLPVADLLGREKGIEVVLLGGALYPDTGLLLGPLCERQLRSLRADILVMGVGGITAAGFTNSNVQLVGTERVMMEVSDRCVVAADSSKFGRTDEARLAALSRADVVVTDAGASPSFRAILTRAGVKLLVACGDGEIDGANRGREEALAA